MHIRLEVVAHRGLEGIELGPEWGDEVRRKSLGHVALLIAGHMGTG